MKKEEVLNLLENDSMVETQDYRKSKKPTNIGRLSGLVAEKPRKKPFPKPTIFKEPGL